MDMSFDPAVVAPPAIGGVGRDPSAPHLDALEAEAIHILREVVAECANSALLFSRRQGFGGGAAPGAEGVLSRSGCRFRCCTSTPDTISPR